MTVQYGRAQVLLIIISGMKSQTETEWATPKTFIFVLALPLRTPLLCGCRRGNDSDASHVCEDNQTHFIWHTPDFLYTFLAPCSQVLDAVGSQPAAGEMGPRLSKCCFREDPWVAGACAQLHISAQNVPHGSTGICRFFGEEQENTSFILQAFQEIIL